MCDIRIKFCSMAIQLGKYNQLIVKRAVDFGLYLGEENDTNDVLLPKRYVKPTMKIGSTVNVFIYKDNENRIIATTAKPKAIVGEFALLKVKNVNQTGAFLDWGIMKDLLVPFREQKVKMQENRHYIVYLYIDDSSQRIVASAKLDKFLDNCIPAYKTNEQVEVLITKRTELGYKVIIENKFWGIIYHNQIFQDVNIGEKHIAHIHTIREDGKIDLFLGKAQVDRLNELMDSILKFLSLNNGEMNITDSSSPDIIKATFHCSKKDFKKALGQLYKHKLIDLSDKTKVTLLSE